MLRAWESEQRTKHGAYVEAAARLDPMLRAEAEAARMEAEARRQAAAAHAASGHSAHWYSRPKRQIKDTFIGLTHNPSCELGWGERKRECPVCAHRWLDKCKHARYHRD